MIGPEILDLIEAEVLRIHIKIRRNSKFYDERIAAQDRRIAAIERSLRPQAVDGNAKNDA
jgi:hypothetical protein